jgi:AcrR family transcriptional regulator
MNYESPKRPYRQSARANAARATAARILDAFARQMQERWFDEIRLDDVARKAGVTPQTVIRRFGGKEGLLDAMHERLGAEIRQRREVAEGEVGRAVSSIVEDYETTGDLILRTLAQEERYEAVKAMTDIGRTMHRQWLEQAFAPWLNRVTGEERRRMLDALVVAGDIYVWKLLRRDMNRPLPEYRAQLEKLIASALGLSPEELFAPSIAGDQR